MAATVMVALYLDMKLLVTNGIVTFAVNVVFMLIFPAGFLKLHSIIGWIFYFILFTGCLLNVYRTNYLFGMVEEKGKDMQNLLSEVQSLSEELYTAGATLSAVSENESASAEELAATSEQLVESSNILSSKTDESMSSNAGKAINEMVDKMTILLKQDE